MGKLIKTKPSICRSCQYHMGFGCQQGKSCLEKYEFNNVACNYLAIMGHSRIFEDGKPTYDPKYCDKYEKGKKIQREWKDAGIVFDCNLD